MRRLGAVLAAVVVMAAACGDDGGDEGGSPTSTTAAETTTSAAAATTEPATTAEPNLDAAAVTLTPVAAVEDPTAMAVREGDATLYVTEQAGRVLAIGEDGTPRPILDLTGEVTAGGEQGLLGLAFSPDGSQLYVHYSAANGDTRVVEYSMTNGAVDEASSREVLAVAQPQPNHNGGQLAFGPDGLLYIGLGDGGGGGDQGPGHEPGGNGQSLNTLLGKILRIDPRGTGEDIYTVPADNPYAEDVGGRPEIWAYGLRNPWRFSFDRETDDLWIGDVGQNAWEEIDYLPAGEGAGANFGWARLEGSQPFDGDPPPDAVPPIFEYPNPDEGCSVTGGFVYRGVAIPDLQGAYVFADYCAGELRALTQENGELVAERFLDVSAANIAAFGEDHDGELYVLSQGDGLLRIDPA